MGCSCPKGGTHLSGCVEQPNPLAGNEPVESILCTLGIDLQGIVDDGRRIAHEIGLRPYRVFLVWRERNEQSREFEELERLELTPVRLASFDGMDLSLSAGGLQPDGALVLRDVSPQQVSEWTLRGYRGGKPWGIDDPDEEFFYEVQLHERSLSDRQPRRRRFNLGAEPSLNGEGYEWRIGLFSQEVSSDPAGRDRTVEPGQSPIQGPRLVF